MHPMLNIAVRAARNAGKVIVRTFEQTDKVEVDLKGQNDLVTNIDREAESIIIDTIKNAYPEHSIIGEETGVVSGEDDSYQWIIDPLDGTTNFVKGIPHFAVSIALKVNGKLDQAVVFDPIRGELFTASRGKGAQLNGMRIRVNKAKELSGAVLATGFPFKQKQHMNAFMEMFKAMFTKTADMRRAGSAALDLAYVAAGRVDGYFELGLKPWDSAAGELLVIEAGGLVTDFRGGAEQSKTGNIIAASPKLVKEMVKDVRPFLGDAIR
ncbi:inositol-1-monophosphatase [Thalassotalea agarivorans]|uniref:Inositol-1-monophosphatase n=1 Tax=Thalassotalea agarivorans TaxID=349064 RepID=A0A1H9YNN8_THASX|nr:inositol-1-monophosphatase [Thalassotalea agarivorans]SES70746.1 myo-inositol-1(or 4)-monophosphatase [Thalassotalea agarivorans]